SADPKAGAGAHRLRAARERSGLPGDRDGGEGAARGARPIAAACAGPVAAIDAAARRTAAELAGAGRGAAARSAGATATGGETAGCAAAGCAGGIAAACAERVAAIDAAARRTA